MSEQNQPKITFKVRERGANDYKLPMGMTPELSQALKDIEKYRHEETEEERNRQDIKQTAALQVLNTYEEALKKHEGKNKDKVKSRPFFLQMTFLFPVFLIILFIAFFMLIRMLSNLSKENKYQQAVTEAVSTEPAAKKEIAPQLLQGSDVPKVERMIKHEESRKEKAVQKPVKEKPVPEEKEPVKTKSDEEIKNQILKDLTNMMDARLSAKEEINSILGEAFQKYPQDLDFHAKIVRLFLTHKHKTYIYDQYRDWAKRNQNSYAANMISAILLSQTVGEQEQLLKNACAAQSDNPQKYPYIKLLELYETAGAWKEAFSICEEMLMLFPDDVFARVKKAEVQIYSGEDRNKIYNELKKYASTKPLDVQAELLFSIAQDFMDEAEAENLLNTKDLKEKLPEKYQYYALRHSLIFDKPVEKSVLEKPLSRRCRYMQLLYHLSYQQFSDVMQITTPPDEYPDFAKVFVNWYNGNPKYLPELQTKMLNKNSGKNITVTLVCRFWQNEITADQLRGNLQLVPTEDLAFVYVILAEDARRKGRDKSAEVLIAKAKQLPRNVFTTMLRTYNK